MLVAGIILLIIGIGIILLVGDGRAQQLGYVVAVIGVLAIILALVLNLTDEAGNGELDADLVAPLLAASLWKARLR